MLAHACIALTWKKGGRRDAELVLAYAQAQEAAFERVNTMQGLSRVLAQTSGWNTLLILIHRLVDDVFVLIFHLLQVDLCVENDHHSRFWPALATTMRLAQMCNRWLTLAKSHAVDTPRRQRPNSG